MARGRIWTDKETDMLLRLCREHTKRELSVIMNRSVESIKIRLAKLCVSCKYEKRGAPVRRTKEERKALLHEWYLKNRERLIEYQRAYYEEIKNDKESYEILKFKRNERYRKRKEEDKNKKVVRECLPSDIRNGGCIRI